MKISDLWSAKQDDEDRNILYEAEEFHEVDRFIYFAKAMFRQPAWWVALLFIIMALLTASKCFGQSGWLVQEQNDWNTPHVAQWDDGATAAETAANRHKAICIAATDLVERGKEGCTSVYFTATHVGGQAGVFHWDEATNTWVPDEFGGCAVCDISGSCRNGTPKECKEARDWMHTPQGACPSTGCPATAETDHQVDDGPSQIEIDREAARMASENGGWRIEAAPDDKAWGKGDSSPVNKQPGTQIQIPGPWSHPKIHQPTGPLTLKHVKISRNIMYCDQVPASRSGEACVQKAIKGITATYTNTVFYGGCVDGLPPHKGKP